MKNMLKLLTGIALIIGIATTCFAKREKKNSPKSNRTVEEAIQAAGGEHWPEKKMKVKKIGEVEVGDTYYHIVKGELKDIGYRIIVFDNIPEYLGYYPSSIEPDYAEKDAIYLDSGDADDEGDPIFYKIKIPLKGPAKQAVIDGAQVAFVYAKAVAAPGAAGATTAAAQPADGETADAADDPTVPAYREWIITRGGKKITARALYVKQDFGKVWLKSEGNGNEVAFAITELSKEDQEYVKKFK